MRKGWLIFVFNVYFIPGFCQSAGKQIDSLMKVYYKPDLPGAVIAVEQNNKTIFKKAYGKASLITGLSITADDNFNIGSLTKQFTAFAVLDLFYKGKFSQNDSIGKFLKLPYPVSSDPDLPAAQPLFRNSRSLWICGYKQSETCNGQRCDGGLTKSRFTLFSTGYTLPL